NHRLGRGSEGNFDKLQPLAAECGFELECVAQHREDGEDKVSSTVVRNVIAEGDMERAARLLGARYMLSGVADGGTIAGIDEFKMLPPTGEYHCDVECDGSVTPATINILGRTATLSIALSGRVIVIF
ncbi:MAG: hypothetical protein IKY89_03115, partial [Alistipes sp.]|nr:hypothetical protein [Alistipes sp.]